MLESTIYSLSKLRYLWSLRSLVVYSAASCMMSSYTLVRAPSILRGWVWIALLGLIGMCGQIPNP